VLKRESPSPGAGGGGDFRQSQVFPRHRFGAARAEHQGGRLRLCRLLHGACRHRTVCRGLRRRQNALDKLEGFASFHGADFYGLPRNAGTITLKREAQAVPASLDYAARATWLVPLRAWGEHRLAAGLIAVA
jgi:dihydroorotase